MISFGRQEESGGGGRGDNSETLVSEIGSHLSLCLTLALSKD